MWLGWPTEDMKDPLHQPRHWQKVEADCSSTKPFLKPYTIRSSTLMFKLPAVSPFFELCRKPSANLFTTRWPSQNLQTALQFFHAADPSAFPPAALPRNPKLESKRCPQACIPCRKRKTKCDGSNPICGHCHTYELPCSYLEDPSMKRKRARDRELQRIYRGRTREDIENFE
jgi:hypothetical protein